MAVIGAGMAGRAHANGYRTASTVFEPDLPAVRLVAIADVNEPFAADAARRYGFERAETDWQAIVDAPDIDAVSVVVANNLHREIVEALLAAGKHVLCEKPLAPSVEDAEAMVDAAADAATGSPRSASPSAAHPRSTPIRAAGGRRAASGRPLHFNGHYWCDYGCRPAARR